MTLTPAPVPVVPLATVNGPDDRPRPLDAVDNDPAEVERVAILADDLFPMMDFGGNVRRYRQAWPIEWMREALIDVSRWSGGVRSFGAVIKVLRSWKAHGGPPRPAPPEDRPSPGKVSQDIPYRSQPLVYSTCPETSPWHPRNRRAAGGQARPPVPEERVQAVLRRFFPEFAESGGGDASS